MTNQLREVEAHLLGAALLTPSVLLDVVGKLEPAHFKHRPHRALFEALKQLWQERDPIVAQAVETGAPLDVAVFAKRVRPRLEEALKAAGCEPLVASWLGELQAHAAVPAMVGALVEELQQAALRQERALKARLLAEAIERGDAEAEARLRAELEALSGTASSNGTNTAMIAAAPAKGQTEGPEPLEFPQDALTGIAGDFARVYAAHTEVPAHFFFVTFLTYLGHLLAYQVRLKSVLDVPPRLYTVLIGPSADGRKSTALNLVDGFYRNTFCDDLRVHYGLGSAEGLAKELEPQDGQDGPVSLLLHLDELKLLVDKCAQKGSVALPLITSLFERTEFDNRTKGGSIRLRNAHLSLVSACTTETFQSMWSPTFTDIGLVNRLFLVHGHATKRIFLPKPVPDGQVRELQRDLATIVGSINALYKAQGVVELEMTPEAEAVLQAWYEGLSRSVHARRLEAYALRFCLLLAINDGETRRVTPDVAERVIKLMEYELAVRQLYDPVDADSKIAALEERIRRQLRAHPTGLTESELKTRVGAYRDGLWAFNAAKNNLMEAGEITFSSAKRRYIYTADPVG